MTTPARIALARSVLAAGVVVVVAAASLPWVVSTGVEVFHAVVAALRGAGHGLLSVEDGFVTATVVTAATAPLPALVAAAVPTSDRRAVGWATLGTGVLVSIVAARSSSAGATWVSLAAASAVGLLLGCLVLASFRARTASATPRSRRIATWLIVVYGVGVVLVGFTGSPVDAGLHPGILRVLEAAHRVGVPDWFGYAALEFTANVAFFVPLGLLVVLVTGARRWWLGAIAGLVVSAAIEAGQALFLPARFASFDDVLANTSGAVIGALIGVVVLGWAAGHRNR
ncbi:VanZ family protein [Curtobacterium sp. VKM Ac-1376]|uniref:VanZ family protein n=1 Tax=Curtobacterium sp. VKM Ac-1376 TaxID=123312 RepID=UPI00188D37B0|nr:VanZ family protein [Curtobacterium sp. VKM Ac-1376]MBF4614160.1 VanZ family protein [Curtobacterium sp. VKM Ac-1376]